MKFNDKNEKWKERGFASKQEYLGWLFFNDLVGEEYTYDDVYYDIYSGQVIDLMDEEFDEETKKLMEDIGD